jgi:hypothetical protein
MTYTVITLVLTCIGFLYGIVFNLTHRRYYNGKSPLKARLLHIGNRLVALRQRILSRLVAKTKTE